MAHLRLEPRSHLNRLRWIGLDRSQTDRSGPLRAQGEQVGGAELHEDGVAVADPSFDRWLDKRTRSGTPARRAYLIGAFWTIAVVVFGVVERLVDPKTFHSAWLSPAGFYRAQAQGRALETIWLCRGSMSWSFSFKSSGPSSSARQELGRITGHEQSGRMISSPRVGATSASRTAVRERWGISTKPGGTQAAALGETFRRLCGCESLYCSAGDLDAGPPVVKRVHRLVARLDRLHP
jgi:hypothetical protein